MPVTLAQRWRAADAAGFDPDGPGPLTVGTPTSYTQTSGLVFDGKVRTISNLISDQSIRNPVAVSVAGPTPIVSSDGTLFIPNVAPDTGLSAPYNSFFTIFGQFFDHGLSLIGKGGQGTVMIPLAPDDPRFVVGSSTPAPMAWSEPLTTCAFSTIPHPPGSTKTKPIPPTRRTRSSCASTPSKAA
jgi:hypothetical protein